VRHDAKRGTNGLASLLEAERIINMVQLRVLGGVVHESAHDIGLLGLGEALHAVLHVDKDYFAKPRQEGKNTPN
jgi:hypothetical protein